MAGILVAVEVPSPWVNKASPTITKLSQLPNGIPPSTNNFDCNSTTTRLYGTTSMQSDCVVQTPFGLMGNYSVFTGTSESIPVVAPFKHRTVRPIPNQSLTYILTQEPLIGQYMRFYKDFRRYMKPAPDKINKSYKFVLTAEPDMVLGDSSGRPLAVNFSAMAFSKNGNWMVADLPGYGFVRLNLATFNMVTFRSSMNSPGDTRTRAAQLSISNDGRYAAIHPALSTEFHVYDINSCAEVSVDQAATCQFRDYSMALRETLPTLKSMYQVRFMNENQLSFSATYDYVGPGNYKVAQYAFTAPGITPGGIEYLGMGDSFASGQGAFNYVSGTDTDNNACHLSSLSYPILLSQLLFDSGKSVACSGAKSRDVTESSVEYRGQSKDRIKKEDRKNIEFILSNYSPGYLAQNDFLERHNPQAITLSIGGNDIGFSDIVKQCVMPKLRDTTCYSTYEEQQELKERILKVGDKLRATYRTVSSPGRKVYVIGYPQLVAEGSNCAANVHLDDKEIKLFIDLTNLLNQVVKQAADSSGAQFVDVSDAFYGHRMCEAKSSRVAVNGFTLGDDAGIKNYRFIGAESYHPNALGHELLLRAILGKTNNMRGAALPSVDVPADVGLPYADAPKSGKPLQVSASDDELAKDTVFRGSEIDINVSPQVALLKPSAPFSVRLGDDNILSSVNTDENGYLTGRINLPDTISCGYYTLHVTGPNILGQTTDISKVVYVDSGSGDCDNDGVADTAQPCGPISVSGIDEDSDGIDDACDPRIILEPVEPQYRAYLTGSTILIRR